jgi:hypothetical protein
MGDTTLALGFMRNVLYSGIACMIYLKPCVTGIRCA